MNSVVYDLKTLWEGNMKKITVLALGHAALGTTMPEQKQAVKLAAKHIADQVEKDRAVVVTHSNGPQIGMIHTAMNEFSRLYPEYTDTPMSVCSAMSQGYIGYDIQNAVREDLLDRGIVKTVVTVLTQVEVDPYDDAFYEPSKKIGRLLDKTDALIQDRKGNHVTEVEGGYRRIVAAPKPMKIIEIDAIRALLAADAVVIACGGGGIPVLAQGHALTGASAVIEKDLAAGVLADSLDAEELMILTGTDYVYDGFGTDHAKALDKISTAELKKLVTEGGFEKGTILPKLAAADEFIGDSAIRRVIIGNGETGTVITK